MKIALLFCSLSMTAGASFAASAAKSRYPQVEALSGRAVQVQEKIQVSNRHAERQEIEKPLKVKTVFKDKALLRTEAKSELRVALSSKASIQLEENTQVEFPAIEWQDGAIPEIRLNKGALRYLCDGGCSHKIVTSLFEGGATAQDFILLYDPAIPVVEISVLKGEMSFQGLQNESSTLLTAGHRTFFKGVLENGEPAYDILLRGRKVAKGQMGTISEIPPDELAQLLKQEEKRKKVAKQAPKSQRQPLQICDKPWGELNQCLWRCEKNKKNAKECRLDLGAQCVRQRCNANGEWSDRTELPQQNSPCKAQVFVGACDY